LRGGEHMSHEARTVTRFSFLWRCGLALLMLASLGSSPATALQETVSVPWRPGNSALLQAGTPEEQGRQAAQGVLPVRIYRPDAPGRIPFVVLLHGCGGLHYETMWQKWV
jgi:poly(3-hydroxybutyrate) depolymerase